MVLTFGGRSTGVTTPRKSHRSISLSMVGNQRCLLSMAKASSKVSGIKRLKGSGTGATVSADKAEIISSSSSESSTTGISAGSGSRSARRADLRDAGG